MDIKDSIEFRSSLYNSLCSIEPRHRKEILDGIAYAYHLTSNEKDKTYEQGLLEGTLLSILDLFHHSSEEILTKIDIYEEAGEVIRIVEKEIGFETHGQLDIPMLLKIVKDYLQQKQSN